MTLRRARTKRQRRRYGSGVGYGGESRKVSRFRVAFPIPRPMLVFYPPVPAHSATGRGFLLTIMRTDGDNKAIGIVGVMTGRLARLAAQPTPAATGQALPDRSGDT